MPEDEGIITIAYCGSLALQREEGLRVRGGFLKINTRIFRFMESSLFHPHRP
jgi:hypothetical protein